MRNGKQKAALSSVFAAVFLTGMKTAIGVGTGSLGILSEAAHSALDLCAALITFFAVKYSDKPADAEHQYGHGKMESFSALVETLLLFITCGWIIYEAVEKMFFGKSLEIVGVQWGVGIMLISIMVDYSRAKILKRAAKEHGSQALEADALHFSSDVWSSMVVIGGLVCVGLGNAFKLPILEFADPLAALGVSILVIKVSIQLGKKTIDVLLDKAPDGMSDMVLQAAKEVNGVLEVGNIRVRPSGPDCFITINVGIDPNESYRSVHSIVREIAERIAERIPKSDITVSTFPISAFKTSAAEAAEAAESVKRAIKEFSNCANVHHVNVYEIGDQRRITAHIELKENITLKESHELSHKISQFIQSDLDGIDGADIHFEYEETQILAEDITDAKQEIIDKIREQINGLSSIKGCHDVKLLNYGDKFATFLHCELNEDITVDKLECVSDEIASNLKSRICSLENVYIHFEPFEGGGIRSGPY